MTMLISLLCGLLFGTGLIVSGMADPAKVLAFLDITRMWDPSLALVMVGAIMVGLIAFRVAKRRTQAVLGGVIQRPDTTKIDVRLVAGAVLFGVGWGLAGICPGPALILLSSGIAKGGVFVIAMLVGMTLYQWVARRLPG